MQHMGSMHGVYSRPCVAGGVPGVREGPGPRDRGQPAAPRQRRHRRQQNQHGGHDRAAPGGAGCFWSTFKFQVETTVSHQRSVVDS